MKLTNYYNKIQSIYDGLDDLIGQLEEKQNAIEDKAIEHDRDMTEQEQNRYDEIDEQIRAIDACKDNLEYAMSEIENYTD